MTQDMPSAIRKPAHDAVVAGKHGAPLISDAKLVNLHAMLLRASGAAIQAAGASAAKIKFPAVYAALLADLAPHDRITADIPLNLKPFGIDATLEVSPSVATGLAIGLQQQQPGALVIAFTRSDRLNADEFRETLRTAARYHAPVLYALLPASSTTNAFDWSARAIREDVPCIPVDAHDAVALYRVAQETMQRARHQGGPSVIDCKQVQLARGDSNSVTRMEAHLRRKGLLSAADRHASRTTLSSNSRLASAPANYDQTGYR